MACVFSNLLLGSGAVDISVENGTIASIVPAAGAAEGAVPRPVVPAFYNCHTHLAMNLLRGYADDLELMPWLQEHIWPAEAHLTDDIVYAGTRLAILEMIRCGTVFANDMYWYAPAVARAAEEMGIRCAVSMQTIETGGPGHNDPKNIASNKAPAARRVRPRIRHVRAARDIYRVRAVAARHRCAGQGREHLPSHACRRDPVRGRDLQEGARRAHAGRLPERPRPAGAEDGHGALRASDGRRHQDHRKHRSRDCREPAVEHEARKRSLPLQARCREGKVPHGHWHGRRLVQQFPLHVRGDEGGGALRKDRERRSHLCACRGRLSRSHARRSPGVRAGRGPISSYCVQTPCRLCRASTARAT